MISNETRIISACAQVLVYSALKLLEDDNHMWSERPCPTCRTIGHLIGRAFGCYAYAVKLKQMRLNRLEPRG